MQPIFFLVPVPFKLCLNEPLILLTCNLNLLHRETFVPDLIIVCDFIRRLLFSLRFSELRLRQYLGTRYDAIPNVFDWDYNMKLVEKGVRTNQPICYSLSTIQNAFLFGSEYGYTGLKNQTLCDWKILTLEENQFGPKRSSNYLFKLRSTASSWSKIVSAKEVLVIFYVF